MPEYNSGYLKAVFKPEIIEARIFMLASSSVFEKIWEAQTKLFVVLASLDVETDYYHHYVNTA